MSKAEDDQVVRAGLAGEGFDHVVGVDELDFGGVVGFLFGIDAEISFVVSAEAVGKAFADRLNETDAGATGAAEAAEEASAELVVAAAAADRNDDAGLGAQRPVLGGAQDDDVTLHIVEQVLDVAHIAFAFERGEADEQATHPKP